MNVYEAQDHVKQMYPDKLVILEFDEACLRLIEVIHTEGKPHSVHHVEYDRVKVSVDGITPFYMSIQPHRMCCTLQWVKDHINKFE